MFHKTLENEVRERKRERDSSEHQLLIKNGAAACLSYKLFKVRSLRHPEASQRHKHTRGTNN